jgi:hypothetical protein
MPPYDVNALPKVALLCIDDDQALLEYEKDFSRNLWVCRRGRIQWPRRNKRAIKTVD